MGLPATATPASKGMQLLKCSFPLGRDTYSILYVICVSQPASCSRLSGCFMGGTRRCQQVGQWGASRRASVRCSEERSPTQIYHRRLHPAQDARERQLWQGSRGEKYSTEQSVHEDVASLSCYFIYQHINKSIQRAQLPRRARAVVKPFFTTCRCLTFDLWTWSITY